MGVFRRWRHIFARNTANRRRRGSCPHCYDISSSFDEMLREKSPTDLKMMNRKTLRALGASEKETERFLNNSAFSPSAQTAFVLNLRSLNRVANRGAFVRTAGETSADESDALFCVQPPAH